MNNQETQGTTNDVDPASVDRVVMTRMAVAFERIAAALEVRVESTNDASCKTSQSMKEVLKELLEHCEKQSGAAAKRARIAKRYSKNAEVGNDKASAKWKRFAVAIRNVLENSSS